MNLDIISASRSLVAEAWKQPEKWEANLTSAGAMLARALIEAPGNVLASTCFGAVLCDQGEHPSEGPRVSNLRRCHGRHTLTLRPIEWRGRTAG